MSLESFFNSVAWQRAVPKQHNWRQGPILVVVQVMALEDLTKLLRLLLTLGGSHGRERRFLRPRPTLPDFSYVDWYDTAPEMGYAPPIPLARMGW